MDVKSLEYREHISKIAADDAKVVVEKDKQYGASWCKRGGVGAFMVMIRKVDRIEQRCEQLGWDIFKAVAEDNREEGLIDDIRDLRGYLLLIEGYLIENKMVAPRYVVEVESCDARMNGFVCQRPKGHSGDHSTLLPVRANIGGREGVAGDTVYWAGKDSESTALNRFDLGYPHD
jgi:hypothetical protein